MNDRMTVAQQTRWHEDLPPVGRIVSVWYWFLNRQIDAYHDGATWRMADGTPITGITHWQEKRHA